METGIYIVLNEKLKELEAWRLPNIVIMLGMMVGTKIDASCIGPAIEDASGIKHAGIGNVMMPILSMQETDMANFYTRCKDKEKEEEINVFDFALCAQNSKAYDDYESKLTAKTLDEQTILGIALCGDKKAVRSLCGSLPRWK